ncbi:MAG: hypothetical protein KJ804_09090 [Proteobacteria bacterium]|nr:hypothetical protein [Pseudomonadota bacterium]MBU1058454.1 hypothetical protein [Pseudomonadota bacterium]
MKELILASKTDLQAALSYIKDRDIYVTEDIRLIRNSGGYPAIGIKDGATGFATLSSDQDEESLSITFAVYVQLFKPEAGVMGDGNKKGVLDVATDVIATLRNNDLGGLVESALPSSQGGSEILGNDNLAILMVPVTMQYTRFDTL